MIKRYCDRCRKEISQYSLFTGKIVADAGERPILMNSLEYELCAGCVNLLLDFFTPKPKPIETINAAPTIEERKKGKWMTVDNPNYSPFDCSAGKISVCSVCGYAREQYDFNYCPNCGADMKEEKTDES